LKLSSIEIVFPNRFKAIAKKRQSDKALDEICRDFELLSADLLKLTAQQSGDAVSKVGELLSSLEGLRQEIDERL
jgi:hypothetical protein